MLVLSRKPNEAVIVGDDVEVTVLEVSQGRVKLGFEAPRGMRILRAELWVDAKSLESEAGRFETCLRSRQ
jgi:carbon storage regulator